MPLVLLMRKRDSNRLPQLDRNPVCMAITNKKNIYAHQHTSCSWPGLTPEYLYVTNYLSFQDELASLLGMKCAVYHTHKWGGQPTLHNAMVSSVLPREDNDQFKDLQVNCCLFHMSHLLITMSNPQPSNPLVIDYFYGLHVMNKYLRIINSYKSRWVL